MKEPNFFIVGAPKCGTTALSVYLGEHPNIFMSNPKEPHYFAEEFGDYRPVQSQAGYDILFKNVKDYHVAIGEASTGYLASMIAIDSISSNYPDAKIIVMLRNPVDLVYSLHQEEYFIGHEKICSFEDAWNKQGDRINNGNKNPIDNITLQYYERGRIGSQVKNLLKYYPKKQVKFIVFDDFISNTKAIYDDVLSFLNVPNDSKDSFPPVNESKKPRSRLVSKIFIDKPYFVGPLTRAVKRVIGVSSFGIGQKIINLNKRGYRRPEMQNKLRQEITSRYRDEIDMLGYLLERDLSHWLKP